MKKLLIMLCMLVVGSVQASDYYEPEPAPSASANAGALAVGVGIAGAHASSTNHLSQGQGQSQSNSQGQYQQANNAQNQSANNEGNHQKTNINFEDKRQAPAIGGPASGPCTGLSAGASFIGGAINFASVDGECEKREAARVAHMLGAKDIAYKVLMSLDAVKAVMEDQQAKIESRSSDKVAFTASEQEWFDNL